MNGSVSGAGGPSQVRNEAAQPHKVTLSAEAGDYQANIQRFANLGVDVQITELDIAGANQAAVYASVTRSCRMNDSSRSLTAAISSRDMPTIDSS